MSESFTVNTVTNAITVNTTGVANTVTSGTQVAVPASQVAVADSAGIFIGTSAEAVLAELPRHYAALVPAQPLSLRVMASPPVIGTKTTTASASYGGGIASPQIFNLYQPNSNQVENGDQTWFTTTIGGGWTRVGNTFPNYFYGLANLPSSGGAGGSNPTRVEFMVDAQVFEFTHKGVTGNWRMWVDGELVSATPTSIPNDGAAYYQPITFASKALRHIVLDLNNVRFGAVVVGPTDSVYQAAQSRPRCLVIGDSFVEGTASESVNNFATQLGAHLGWDCWTGGVGGTGFVAGGASVFSSRLALYPTSEFDVIVVAGSVNDCTAGNMPGVQAAATALFTAIRARWPYALLITTSPGLAKGVEGWLSPGGVSGGYYINVRDAIKAAALAMPAPVVPFIDLMEMTLHQTAATGTLQASPIAGATTISSSWQFPQNTTIDIGTGTTSVERRRIVSTSGAGPYTLTVAALTNGHTSGDVCTQVGQPLWTGLGKLGATTGSGNCDLYVFSDGVHPTTVGHAAIGRALAHLIATQLHAY